MAVEVDRLIGALEEAEAALAAKQAESSPAESTPPESDPAPADEGVGNR